MDSQNKKRRLKGPSTEQTIPHQVDSPNYQQGQMKDDIKQPFVNQYGVVIGDSFYDSANSPLNNWSTDVDPAIMAGDQWVHPTNDIGWNTSENQDLLEQGIAPEGIRFMHPDKDVSYGKD